MVQHLTNALNSREINRGFSHKKTTIADAILDRLVHNASKIKMKGESLRKMSALT